MQASPSRTELEKIIEEEWEGAYRNADYYSIPWERLRPPSRLVRLVEEGRISKGRALDVGCGLGTTSIYLAKAGFDVTALDISKTALEFAAMRAKREKVDIEFIKGSAHRLFLPSEHFALVFDRGCLHHLPRELWGTYVNEVHRVLRKACSFYLECFSETCKKETGHRFTKQEISSLFGNMFNIGFMEESTNKGPEGEVAVYTAFMKKPY